MSFLIRTAFWLGIVIVLLPTGTPPQSANAPQVGAVDALSAAGAAVSDVGQFCARQPEACAVGSQAATAFGHKAQASAKWLYEFLTEKLEPENAAGHPEPAVAPVRPQPRPGIDRPSSQSTLTAADRTPAWRGGSQTRPERHAGAVR